MIFALGVGHGDELVKDGLVLFVFLVGLAGLEQVGKISNVQKCAIIWRKQF